MMRAAVPRYDDLQEALVAATLGPSPSPSQVRRVLDLGTGTGETARRVLAAHPGATLIGVEAGERMVALGRDALADLPATVLLRRLEEPLPAGPFDLVVAALAVHHLDAAGKRDLFRRIRSTLAAAGRLVIGDVVLTPAGTPEPPTPIDPAVDHPDSAADQLRWLAGAGFAASVAWSHGDLAVLTAGPPAELLHVTPAAEHDPTAPHHCPSAFAADGFVHLCTRTQLPGVLERYYAGRTDLRILTLDGHALLPDLRWEPGVGADPGPFPHLYAPIPASAIQGV
jgi:tRNA (cmo5U34)-methyltransferase